jgi:hypothetical protein
MAFFVSPLISVRLFTFFTFPHRTFSSLFSTRLKSLALTHHGIDKPIAEKIEVSSFCIVLFLDIINLTRHRLSWIDFRMPITMVRLFLDFAAPACHIFVLHTPLSFDSFVDMRSFSFPSFPTFSSGLLTVFHRNLITDHHTRKTAQLRNITENIRLNKEFLDRINSGLAFPPPRPSALCAYSPLILSHFLLEKSAPRTLPR